MVGVIFGYAPNRVFGIDSFSEINLNSDKLGKKYSDRNAKLCSIITEIAKGIASFSTDSDVLGDAYEYLIGQFAAGSGKKADQKKPSYWKESQLQRGFHSVKRSTKAKSINVC